MTKFNLVEALEEKGFKPMEQTTYNGAFARTVTVYAKKYTKAEHLVGYGDTECAFEVEVTVVDSNDGKTPYVRAAYSNGKVKEHMADKRAYNAIKATVENNGYEF